MCGTDWNCEHCVWYTIGVIQLTKICAQGKPAHKGTADAAKHLKLYLSFGWNVGLRLYSTQ